MTKKGAKTTAQQLQFAQDINHHAERMVGLGYWEWDIVEDRLTYCSEGYAHMLDMTVEEVMAAEASSELSNSVLHPDDRRRYIDMEQGHYETGVSVDIEYRVITAKGRLRHFREISEAVKNAAGEIIRTFGIVQDITDSKQQQEELRRTLADARRAESLAKLGTFTWNWIEDRLESCSEEYARIHDLTVEEVLKLHYSSEADLATIHPDDREAFKAVEAAAMAKGEGFTIDYRALLPSGAVGHRRLVCEAELSDRGEVIRYTGSVQDITDQVLLQEQLRQVLKIKAIGQLTGGVAHDFNNLLMVIMGNLDMAMDLLGDSSPATELLARALQAGERGATLTRRLLAFARKQSLQLETVDLQSLVLGMKELLQSTLGETIRVEIQDSGHQWLCETDAAQFESTILNLAINARDAMPNGGSLHIALNSVDLDENYASTHEAVRAGPHIRLSVSDTGLGMSLDVQAQAFDPFFTTKDVGEGTGLGLSMVYGFLKQCQGHVSIYSEPGEGTVVKLYLPHSPEGSAESTTVSLIDEIRGNNEKILVVEDDREVRKLATLLLADLGYSTVEAKNGREALHLLGSESGIALLFSDVVLPGGMSGMELAEEACRSYPELKVLFTSGYTRDTAQRWGMAGCELLEKPYTKAQLASMLSRALTPECS